MPKQVIREEHPSGYYPQSVISCAACGKSHTINFKKLSKPERIGHFTANYAGMCDKTHILVYQDVIQ